MNIIEFREQLKNKAHRFADTLSFLENNYTFQPTAFKNGSIENKQGQNEGSCKILALAILENFSDEEALLAFAEHYHSVLATPEGQDHQNIRSLMQQGLKTVNFAKYPLTKLNK